MKNRVITDDHRRKISEAHKGKKLSEETKRKLSIANSGKNSPWWGRKHTEEEKRKIAEAQLGSKNHASKLTEEIVVKIRKMYATGDYTQREIVKKLNLDVNWKTVGKIVRGERWEHAGGPVENKGRRPGEKNNFTKTKSSKIIKARNLAKNTDLNYGEIVEELDMCISADAVGCIIRGETWKHIGGPIKGVDY